MVGAYTLTTETKEWTRVGHQTHQTGQQVNIINATTTPVVPPPAPAVPSVPSPSEPSAPVDGGDCPTGVWVASKNKCVEPMSKRIIMTPQLTGGLNNQVFAMGELVRMAAETNATLCWPLVNLKAYSSNWRRFDALFDVDATEQCIRREFGVRMASRADDDEDNLVCNWMISNGREEGVADGPFGRHHVTQPSIMGMTPTELVQSVQMFHHWPPPIPTRDTYMAAYGRGVRIIELYFPLVAWLLREFENEVPRHEHNIPFVEHGCFIPATRLRTIGDQLTTAMLAAAAAHNQITIGVHLRWELDMRCAPDIQWIADRMCQSHQLALPCQKALCLVATGLETHEYEHQFSACARIATKWDFINGSLIEPLLREERAIIDLIATSATQLFFGCARSTFTIAIWALRLAQSPSLTNLAYNMNGLNRGAPADPRCYAGNIRWIQQNGLHTDCGDNARVRH